MSTDVENMLKRVQERTGYSVTVTRSEQVLSNAEMKTASVNNPVHLISLNPRHENIARYLVASQCAMILVKWADPKRIPDLAVSDGQIEALAKRLAPEPQIPMDGKIHLIKGLLLQFVSLPAELMAAELCYRDCPGLRDEQRTCMTAQLREASSALSPKIRAAAPKAVLDRNAVMNSVLTLWWSQVEGSKIALLPYQALGYLKKGEELFADYRSVPADDPERYTKVVDLWAAWLDLKGCYAWRFRSE